MKNLLKITAFLFIMAAYATSAFAQNNIVGKWMDVSDGDTGIVIFDKEGFATVVINGEKMGGRSFEMEGLMTACMTYEFVPAGNKTYKVNLYIKSASPDSIVLMTAPGLIEFITPDKIKFAVNFEHEQVGKISDAQMDALRPKDFKDPDETTTMTRVK